MLFNSVASINLVNIFMEMDKLNGQVQVILGCVFRVTKIAIKHCSIDPKSVDF